MANYTFFKKIGIAISLSLMTILFSLFTPFYELFAETMESNNYKVRTDSVNFGGGDSTSTNYNIGDTLGEIGTGRSSSTNYSLSAGFWQMQEGYISISSPNDLSLTQIAGIGTAASEGTLSWLVSTDSPAGYSMNIRTATIPALKSAVDSFADYVPSGADPDYSFVVPDNSSYFGFSPEGTDVNARFKDNGVICNTGTSENTGICWDGLSTINKIIAGKSTSNHPSGSTVTVRFRAQVGNAKVQTSGAYSASIIVTALTL